MTGELTLGGGPLPSDFRGWVTLFPLDATLGDAVTARVGPSGRFEFPAAPVGLVQVRIDAAEPLRHPRTGALPPAVIQRLNVIRGPGTPLRFTTKVAEPNQFKFDLLWTPLAEPQ